MALPQALPDGRVAGEPVAPASRACRGNAGDPGTVFWAGILTHLGEPLEPLPISPWLGDEGDEPDVAAARRALERKLLPHPRHQFRPGNPGGVV